MIIVTFDFGVDKGAQFKSKRGGIHTVHTVQVSIALFYNEYWCLFYFFFFFSRVHVYSTTLGFGGSLTKKINAVVER